MVIYRVSKTKLYAIIKPNLFIVFLIFCASVITYHFLVPHISHPSMSYHIAIHIKSLDIVVFITTISFISFKRTSSNKFLLISFSFVFLLIVESIYVLQASGIVKIFYIPLIEVEFSHILLLVMLTMFALGVLKTDNRR